MFAIEIEGEFLDLFPDDSFEISRINRMFDKQTSGLYSELPLRVPKTQKNRRVFQFFDSLDNAGYRRSYPAILHVDEMERQGVVKVMSSDDRGFEFYFLGDGSYFFSKAKTKITEFPYFEKFSGGKSQPQENIEVVDETFLSDIGSYTKRYPSANFVFFPMYNPAIKEPPESLDLVSYVNNWDPHGMKFWAEDYADEKKAFHHTYIGHFYLVFVIRKITELLGYNLDYNFLEEDSELLQAVVVNHNYHHIYHSFHQKTHTELEEDSCYMSFERDLPPVTFADLLREVELKFNLTVFVDEELRKVRIERNDSIFQSNRIHSIKKFVAGPIKHTGREQTKIALKNTNPRDESYFDDISFEDIYQKGKGEEKTIESRKMSPLLMYETDRTSLPYLLRSDSERTPYKDDNFQKNNAHIKIALFRGFMPIKQELTDPSGGFEHLGVASTFSNIPNYNDGNPLTSNPSGYYYGENYSVNYHEIERTGEYEVKVTISYYAETQSIKIYWKHPDSTDYWESSSSWEATNVYNAYGTYTIKIVIDNTDKTHEVYYDVGIYGDNRGLQIGEKITGGSRSEKKYTKIFVHDEMKTYRWEKINDTPEYYWVPWEDNSGWNFSENAYPYASSGAEYYIFGVNPSTNLFTFSNFEYSLFFSGLKGLATTLYENYINLFLERMQEAECQLILPQGMIDEKAKYEIDNVLYLIKEIRIEKSERVGFQHAVLVRI